MDPDPGILPCRNLCRCTSARPRFSESMPSPRRVIKLSQTPDTNSASACCSCDGGGKGSSLHESQWSLGAELAWGTALALCVTDELLAHHLGAAFPTMMRSPFLSGTCHTPTCQKQSHKSRQCETVDGVIKERSNHFKSSSSGGKSAAEMHSENLPSLQ